MHSKAYEMALMAYGDQVLGYSCAGLSSNCQAVRDVTKFLPPPKGEGRGEGEGRLELQCLPIKQRR
jgi:hypothetical protein